MSFPGQATNSASSWETNSDASISVGQVWRGALVLNNQAVHMMEKGEASFATEVMKDSLRLNYGLCPPLPLNHGGGGGDLLPSPFSSASFFSSSLSSNSNQSFTEEANINHVVGSSVKNMIRQATVFSSSTSRQHVQQQCPCDFPAVEVRPVEYGDLQSMMCAIDFTVESGSDGRLIFYPIYLRDAFLDHLPSLPHQHNQHQHGNKDDNAYTCRKLRGILTYNLGIAYFLDHIKSSILLVSHTVAASPLLTTALLRYDHTYCQAHLSMDVAHLSFASLLRHKSSISDDLCLTLVSVLSLTCVALIHRLTHDYHTALGAQQTVAKMWNAMEQDGVAQLFTSDRGKVAPAA